MNLKSVKRVENKKSKERSDRFQIYVNSTNRNTNKSPDLAFMDIYVFEKMSPKTLHVHLKIVNEQSKSHSFQAKLIILKI